MSNVDESPFNLVCLICGKMITAEIVDENHQRTMEQLVESANDSGFLPLDAIEMTSYGHYGTTFSIHATTVHKSPHSSATNA